MIPESHRQFLDLAKEAPPPAWRLPIRRARRADDDATIDLRIGMIAAVGFFGLFLGWASLARLDAATHATGAVTVSGSRQVVQHRDGGIVSALHVIEGQHVRRGEVLVELAPAELAATARALPAQVVDRQAQSARLDAEETGTATVDTPAAFAALPIADRGLAEAALAHQRAELKARRRALGVQKAALGKQAAEFRERVGGIGEQIAAGHRQTRLFDEELGGMRALLAKGFASANRVRQMERAKEQLGSDTAGLIASAAAARQQIGEAHLQAAALDATQLRDAMEARRSVQANLTDLLPRLSAIRAELERTRIRATASGQVVGLDVTTVGAVIEPGKKLMEIVPDAARLVVTANVSPADADDIHVGQPAEVRLSGLHDRSLPILLGAVSRLSADSFEDQRTGRSFYTAEVIVPEQRLAEIARRHGPRTVLRPGMPVELLIPQRKRTLLQYLLEPLDRALWTSLREG